MWIFHVYVAIFQQHLWMKHTSISWNDARLHQDELCYPLSRHWYAWFVLITGHFICLRSWLVTMCDIWSVVGVSSIMNVTCGTGPYWPSWAFMSNASFIGVAIVQSGVSNEDHCFPFVLSLFDLFPSVCWIWLHKCCLPTFPILIESQIVIVFSTYFIFCSFLISNQITSIQEGQFSNLTKLIGL